MMMRASPTTTMEPVTVASRRQLHLWGSHALSRSWWVQVGVPFQSARSLAGLFVETRGCPDGC
jgi:hypothetical protein